MFDLGKKASKVHTCIDVELRITESQYKVRLIFKLPDLLENLSLIKENVEPVETCNHAKKHRKNFECCPLSPFIVR